jgi:hypothetical protein
MRGRLSLFSIAESSVSVERCSRNTILCCEVLHTMDLALPTSLSFTMILLHLDSVLRV